MIKELVKIANRLDKIGLSKQSDIIDILIKKIASEDNEKEIAEESMEFGNDRLALIAQKTFDWFVTHNYGSSARNPTGGGNMVYRLDKRRLTSFDPELFSYLDSQGREIEIYFKIPSPIGDSLIEKWYLSAGEPGSEAYEKHKNLLDNSDIRMWKKYYSWAKAYNIDGKKIIIVEIYLGPEEWNMTREFDGSIDKIKSFLAKNSSYRSAIISEITRALRDVV